MYDAAEAAANLLLLERDARLVLEMNDPKRALESTLRPLLAQLPRQAERDHEQITHQQFSTPPPLAYVVFWASGARPGDVVIESCAGTGSLAVWARAAGLEVITNELSERRCALLELLDFHPTQFDAELIHEPEFIGESADELVRPSLALANPPWSAAAGRVERNSTIYGANHVTSNLRRLAEGGRLVALVGGRLALDRPHFSGWWRRVVTRYNVRANVSVPGTEFARYGTTYDCQIVIIDKTGPTPGATLREQLANVVHGRAQSLEYLIDLLDGVRSSRPECAPTRGYAPAADDEDLGVINLDAGGETPRRNPDPAWASFYRTPRPSGDAADGEQAAAAEPDRLDALEFLEEAPAAEAPAAGDAVEEEQRAPGADGRRAARRAEDVYVPYVTRKLTSGAEHPAQMVEAATMAAVDPPDITYFPCLQPEIISEGRLSRIQLERVVYAGQRHEQRLFHGERGGFFIGDGTGVGKGRSQPLDAKILTPCGWKLMGEIRVGDEVIAVDGSHTRVLGVYPQGKKAIYRVDFSDGSQTECSEDHLWQTQTKRQRYYARHGMGVNYPNPKVLTTGEIARTIKLSHSIPLVSPVQFPGRKVEIDPYLLGVLVADGSLRRSAVEVTSADEEILAQVAAALPDGLVVKGKANHPYHYAITKKSGRRWKGLPRENNPLLVALRRSGLAGVKAPDKFVPEDYKFNTPAARLAVLQGLMDCDGYVDSRGASMYYTVSARLADDLTFLVRSLGGTATRGIKRTTHLPCHVVYIKLPGGVNPFRLKRKAGRVKPDWVKYPPQRLVERIEPVGEKEAQCIAIDHPSRLYVTNDFIVTHNTLAAIGLDNWNQGRRRILWLSVNNDLIESARRDIHDLGVELPLAQLNNFPVSEEVPVKEGVIFCTYPTLISKSKGGTHTRFDQLVRWLGPDGVVFFDECLPAGTMIATPDGERPVEELGVGDVVFGLDHDTGRIEPTPIRHLFRRETTEPLLRINDTLLTGNHPVWTRERDYVRADEVTPLDTVCELERESTHGREVLHLRMVPPVLHAEVQAEQEERKGAPLLQHVLLGEVENEPAGLRRVPDHRRGSPEAARENDRDPRAQRRTAEAGATPALHLEPVLLAGDQGQVPEVTEGAGLLAPDGRQRRWPDRTAAEAEGATHLARRRARGGSKAVAARLPEALHVGFGGAGTEARRGDRRQLSPLEATERAGRAKGRLPAGEGLDHHQVQKRGGAVGPRTCGQASPQGRTVYNIETGTANYFANRLLVHNCHKAKNVLSTGNGHPTQTGKAVVKLQDAQERPDLRVVYSSATGAQDVRNLAYATRLGLWGEGTPFADFKDFMKKIEEGGIGSMEMCCRDMKALGMYLAASLSYGVDPQSGLAVEYREVPHELTPQQREMYNAAAAAWLYVLNSCREANRMSNGGERQIKSALQGYWGKHQRFFRLVIAAFKIPTVIAAAERALEEGRSPIISLIGTGEARTKEQVALATAEGTDLEDLDFTPREVIAEAVMSCLPTQLYQDKEEDGEIVKVAVTNEEGEPVHCQEALELRRQVLESLTLLDLPDNPLDMLVNHLGAKNVAEITGRKKRLIRRDDGRVEYVKRAPAGVATTKVNVYEQEAFQNGNHLDRYKTSAIISEAGSTGISLHASNRATNRRRREMIIIEYAWSADKQLQIMGRAHRTDQASPPIFTSVPTNLGGERRFSSTIAMRLGSLGALTRGDRAAVDGGNLSKYNYETEHGKAALALLYTRILTIDDLGIPGLPDPRQTLEQVGLITRTKDDTLTVRTEDMTHVPRFLNRVLALDVDRQNALFDEFDRLFRETVAQAKANGTFDEGVTDLRAKSVRVTRPPRVVHVDRTTGARTTHYSLEVDFPTETVIFTRALEIKDERDGVFLQNKHTGRFALATRAGRHTDAETGRVSHTFCLTTPRWEKATYMGESELVEKYRPSYDEEARDWWTVAEALLPEVETCPLHVIGGALLPLWERLAEGHDSMLSVIRVVTDDGLRIVGAEIPAARIARALTALGIAHNIEDTPDVFKAVLEDGRTIHLAANMRLKRTLVNRERAIELLGVNPARFEELRLLGLTNRQIRFKERFLIPTDEDEGVHILNRLLERYPRVDEEAAEAAAARFEESSDLGALDLTPKVFDLEELVRNPRILLPAAPTQTGLFGDAVTRAAKAPPQSAEAEAHEADATTHVPQEPADDDATRTGSEAEFASDRHQRRVSPEAAAVYLKAHQFEQRRKPKRKGGGDNSGQGSFF